MSKAELEGLLTVLTEGRSLFIGQPTYNDPIELSVEAKEAIVDAVRAQLTRMHVRAMWLEPPPA